MLGIAIRFGVGFQREVVGADNDFTSAQPQYRAALYDQCSNAHLLIEENVFHLTDLFAGTAREVDISIQNVFG